MRRVTTWWSFRFGGPGTNSDVASECGMDLALDGNGDVYVVGYYSGAPDTSRSGNGRAGHGRGEQPGTSPSTHRRARTCGAMVSRMAGGTGERRRGDPSGHVYVTGYLWHGGLRSGPGHGHPGRLGLLHRQVHAHRGPRLVLRRATRPLRRRLGHRGDDSANVYDRCVHGTIDMDPTRVWRNWNTLGSRCFVAGTCRARASDQRRAGPGGSTRCRIILGHRAGHLHHHLPGGQLRQRVATDLQAVVVTRTWS